MSLGPSFPPDSQPESAEDSESGLDRRRSGRRARARDRLMDRATRAYPKTKVLRGANDVENLLLFIDDDLRETTMAMMNIEDYLLRTLGLLECEQLRRDEVNDLAGDENVLDQIDALNETLESLRRRLAKLALKLRA